MKLEKTSLVDKFFINFVKKQKLSLKEENFVIKWGIKTKNFMSKIASFIITFWVFLRAFDFLGEKFIILVFTIIVLYFFQERNKV